MPACMVQGCKNTPTGKAAGVTFHRFPSDEAQRKLWIFAIGRESWTPTYTSRLCSAHFTEDAFDRKMKRVKLKPGAVPTIFPPILTQEDKDMPKNIWVYSKRKRRRKGTKKEDKSSDTQTADEEIPTNLEAGTKQCETDNSKPTIKHEMMANMTEVSFGSNNQPGNELIPAQNATSIGAYHTFMANMLRSNVDPTSNDGCFEDCGDKTSDSSIPNVSSTNIQVKVEKDTEPNEAATTVIPSKDVRELEAPIILTPEQIKKEPVDGDDYEFSTSCSGNNTTVSHVEATQSYTSQSMVKNASNSKAISSNISGLLALNKNDYPNTSWSVSSGSLNDGITGSGHLTVLPLANPLNINQPFNANLSTSNKALHVPKTPLKSKRRKGRKKSSPMKRQKNTGPPTRSRTAKTNKKGPVTPDADFSNVGATEGMLNSSLDIKMLLDQDSNLLEEGSEYDRMKKQGSTNILEHVPTNEQGNTMLSGNCGIDPVLQNIKKELDSEHESVQGFADKNICAAEFSEKVPKGKTQAPIVQQPIAEITKLIEQTVTEIKNSEQIAPATLLNIKKEKDSHVGFGAQTEKTSELFTVSANAKKSCEKSPNGMPITSLDERDMLKNSNSVDIEVAKKILQEIKKEINLTEIDNQTEQDMKESIKNDNSIQDEMLDSSDEVVVLNQVQMTQRNRQVSEIEQKMNGQEINKGYNLQKVNNNNNNECLVTSSESKTELKLTAVKNEPKSEDAISMCMYESSPVITSTLIDSKEFKPFTPELLHTSQSSPTVTSTLTEDLLHHGSIKEEPQRASSSCSFSSAVNSSTSDQNYSPSPHDISASRLVSPSSATMFITSQFPSFQTSERAKQGPPKPCLLLENLKKILHQVPSLSFIDTGDAVELKPLPLSNSEIMCFKRFAMCEYDVIESVYHPYIATSARNSPTVFGPFLMNNSQSFLNREFAVPGSMMPDLETQSLPPPQSVPLPNAFYYNNVYPNPSLILNDRSSPYNQNIPVQEIVSVPNQLSRATEEGSRILSSSRDDLFMRPSTESRCPDVSEASMDSAGMHESSISVKEDTHATNRIAPLEISNDSVQLPQSPAHAGLSFSSSDLSTDQLKNIMQIINQGKSSSNLENNQIVSSLPQPENAATTSSMQDSINGIHNINLSSLSLPSDLFGNLQKALQMTHGQTPTSCDIQKNLQHDSATPNSELPTLKDTTAEKDGNKEQDPAKKPITEELDTGKETTPEVSSSNNFESHTHGNREESDDSAVDNEIGNDSDSTITYNDDEKTVSGNESDDSATKRTRYSNKLEKIIERKEQEAERKAKLKRLPLTISNDPKFEKFCEKQRSKQKNVVPVINPLPIDSIESEKSSKKKKKRKKSELNETEQPIEKPAKKAKTSPAKRKRKPANQVAEEQSKLFAPDTKRTVKPLKKSEAISLKPSKDAETHLKYGKRHSYRGTFLTEPLPSEAVKSKSVQKKKEDSKNAAVGATEEFHLTAPSPEIKGLESNPLIQSSTKSSLQESHKLPSKLNYKEYLQRKTSTNSVVSPTTSSLSAAAVTPSSTIQTHVSYPRNEPVFSTAAFSNANTFNFFNPSEPSIPQFFAPPSKDAALVSRGNTYVSPEGSLVVNYNHQSMPYQGPQPSLTPVPLVRDPRRRALSVDKLPPMRTGIAIPVLDSTPSALKLPGWSLPTDKTKAAPIPTLVSTPPTSTRHDTLMDMCFGSPPLNNPIILEQPPSQKTTDWNSFIKPLSGSQGGIPGLTLQSNQVLPGLSSPPPPPPKVPEKCVCLTPKSLKTSVGTEPISSNEALLLILEWSADWLVQQQKSPEPPPVAGTLKHVRNSFPNFNTYFNTYFPLLLHEIWQRIFLSWTRINQMQPLFCEVISHTEQQTCINIKCETFVRNVDFDKGHAPEEGNMLLVKFATHDKSGIKMLGYIKEMASRPLQKHELRPSYLKSMKYAPNEPMQRVTLTLSVVYSTQNIDFKDRFRIQLLCNIKSLLKQIESLMNVKDSFLCRVILNPLEDCVRSLTLPPRNSEPNIVKHTMGTIIEGLSLPHPLPQLIIIRTIPTSDRLLALIEIIKEMKLKHDTKVLVCSRTKTSMNDIAFNLVEKADIVIIGKRADVHRRLRKYLLEDLAAEVSLSDVEKEDVPKEENMQRAKQKVLEKCDVILSLIHFSHHELVMQHLTSEFDVTLTCCIIDEANLCTEPETVIPLLYGISKLILIGDPDIPAKVCSKTAISYDYNRSFFDRAYNLNSII